VLYIESMTIESAEYLSEEGQSITVIWD